jgi:hypothetical protein
LKNVSLLQFATHYNWNKDSVCTKHGKNGALAYIVNIWPHYQPNIDNAEVYEKYCYARMILHHPFGKTPDELLCGPDLLLMPIVNLENMSAGQLHIRLNVLTRVINIQMTHFPLLQKLQSTQR